MLENISQVGSEPPIEAVIMEGVVLLTFFYLSLRTGQRYMKRKAPPVLNLFLSFFFYFLAGVALFTTKSIEHFTEGDIDVSSLGINIGYACSAFGNLFLYYFTLDIFFKEIKPYIREAITLAIGIVVGFLLVFIFTLESPFVEIPGNYVPLHLLIWHVLVSSFIFVTLFYKAFSEWRKTTEILPKTGFLMIAICAIFELLVFIFFFIDSYSDADYTIYYFLGWISASIAGFFAMIGYLMPDWFKNIINSRSK